MARAEPPLRLGVQWSKASAILRGQARPDIPLLRGIALGGHERPIAPDAIAEEPWIGTTPRIALMAHDWGGTEALVGPPSPIDDIRLSRSSRMLVMRVRATRGRIVPFAQLGIGQWRIDTDILPTFRPDVETAAELGGGLEIALTPSVALAVESDATVLYRERHEPQMVCRAQLWDSLLAARGRF